MGGGNISKVASILAAAVVIMLFITVTRRLGGRPSEEGLASEILPDLFLYLVIGPFAAGMLTLIALKGVLPLVAFVAGQWPTIFGISTHFAFRLPETAPGPNWRLFAVVFESCYGLWLLGLVFGFVFGAWPGERDRQT